MSLHEGQEFENLLSAIAEISRLRTERDEAVSRAERARAQLREISQLVDDYVDINNNGGPNLAMQVAMIIEGKS